MSKIRSYYEPDNRVDCCDYRPKFCRHSMVLSGWCLNRNIPITPYEEIVPGLYQILEISPYYVSGEGEESLISWPAWAILESAKMDGGAFWRFCQANSMQEAKHRYNEGLDGRMMFKRYYKSEWVCRKL